VLPACASMPVTCLSAAGSPTLVNENVKFAGGLMALDALCRNNSFYFLLQPNTMNVATKLSKDCLLNPQTQKNDPFVHVQRQNSQGLGSHPE